MMRTKKGTLMSDFTLISNIIIENTKVYLQTCPGLYKTRVINRKEFFAITFKLLSLTQVRIAFTLHRLGRVMARQDSILDSLNDDSEIYDFRQEMINL